MLHSFHLCPGWQPRDGMRLWSPEDVSRCSHLLEMPGFCFSASRLQPLPPPPSAATAARLKACPSRVFRLDYTIYRQAWPRGQTAMSFSPKWLGSKPQASRGEGVHDLVLVSVIAFSVTNISKPYLWLAGHVSVLSEPGYRPCGFLMIYLHKICGMLKMELSTLLYDTSVHVRKWKYFQKW